MLKSELDNQQRSLSLGEIALGVMLQYGRFSL